MELTPITKAMNTNLFERQGQIWKDAFNKDWYFEGWKQKVFLIFCFLTTIASVLYWGWRLLV